MKKMTTYLFIIIALALTLNAAPIKRVLLEQHTGAWCGWCVDGSYIMDNILEEYPDQVIGVKIHNGDQMVIPEQATLAQSMGLTGYPTGSVDRKLFNVGGQGAIFLSRTAWQQASEIMMQEAPSVDVGLIWSFNESSRELTADIDCKILTTPERELRFNVYICEDNVSGSGTGWDQSNYLSGRAGYENNPYYSQPAKIVGYNHMKVVRKMLGGAWGSAGSIPASPAVGSTHKYSYTFTVPVGWKYDDMFLVGIVQEYDATYADLKKIKNCVYGVEGLPYSELTTTGDNVNVVSQGSSFEQTYTLKNVSGEQITYRVNDELSARTPSDWTSELLINGEVMSGKSDKTQAKEVKLNNNSTAEITVKITPGATLGAGDVTISVLNKYDLGGQKSEASVTAISREIQNIEIAEYSDDKYSVTSYMESAGLTSSVALMLNEYGQVEYSLTSIKNLVWNCGEAGQIDATGAQKIMNAVNDQANIFVIGTIAVNKDDNTVKNMLSYLGVRFAKQIWQGLSDGKINLIGYAGDPISNGFDQSCQLENFLAPALFPIDETSTPFLRMKNVDSAVAIRTVIESTSRAIVLGINPLVITNTSARSLLLQKSFEWLAGSGPSISCVDNLNFTETEVGKTSEKVITIENTGKGPLNVTGLEIDYKFEHVFKVVGDDTFTVPAEGTYDLTIEFKPADALEYESWIKITSDADNFPEKTVALTGTGSQGSGGPSIALNKTEITFVETGVGETAYQNLEISNPGTETLNITNISFSEFGNIFSTDQTSLSIDAESKETITVTFQPSDAGTYETVMTISSNSNEGDIEIPVSADAVVGVDDYDVPQGLITLTAGPNPFDLATNIELSFNGLHSANIEIYAIDASGKTVAEIANRSFAPGTYNLSLNASGLASGNYFIIAKTNDFTAQIPVMIVK